MTSGVARRRGRRYWKEMDQVVDCRVCGDPHSILRFAFVEFADEEGARVALNLGGTMLGFYPVKVLPSKTAILPVNPKFLPRSNDEREMVVRTVYCTNIDKKVAQSEVKLFFEHVCGEVSRLRLLGDNVHSTRIAFVEFIQAESAILALNCSGMLLGSLPIRQVLKSSVIIQQPSHVYSYVILWLILFSNSPGLVRRRRRSMMEDGADRRHDCHLTILLRVTVCNVGNERRPTPAHWTGEKKPEGAAVGGALGCKDAVEKKNYFQRLVDLGWREAAWTGKEAVGSG
ncbi:hypothetical protein KSP40_PGU017276 [Platanthera guangdongensis]|uniref:RRM domain-containing protein n=1 Tax=Platanthera guangdongensis TaxID=2320717 RepID=A0ABR2N1S0_9ASPA